MALTAVEEAQLRDLIAQQSALLSLAGVEATILSKLGATKVTLSDLPTASVIDDADLLLLRQGVTDKSVTGLTFKNLIPTVADASTTVKGVVELATDAETQTGTDTTRAITPANLTSRTATDTRTGLVEKATAGEAQAFTSDKYIDGALLALAFKGANQSLAPSGYQKLPGGLIVQWGVINAISGVGDSANVVTLPIAYPNSIFQVYASANDLNIAEGDGVAVGARKITASLTTINVINTGSSTEPVSWLTIGN